MEEHEVQFVEIEESNVFKGKHVRYTAIYEYCDRADEFLGNEEMIARNDLAMKDSYRQIMRLLTYRELLEIRNKYKITQRDLACLLGWGEKTITRYEGHQVQDVAHDAVLRKINSDPEWFLELLEKGKEKISQEAYERYKIEISKEYEVMQDAYLRKSIHAQYMKYQDMPESCGNTKLNLDKIVDVICYYANSAKVQNLYKVKLMKLLWYADFLSYKRYQHSITGLVYIAMPMGALPVAHKFLIDLKGITYEEIEFEDGSGYKFTGSRSEKDNLLSKEDIDILDTIIEIFGHFSKTQIVNKMHEETAYKLTNAGEVISYKYAENLSIR